VDNVNERKSFVKRPHYYWIEKIYTDIAALMLPILDKTFITPNMITILNIINSIFIYIILWDEKYTLTAVMIQIYLFLDILDGNLARYKNMCSKLGKVLDQINDRTFYNLFYIILGIRIGIHWIWIATYLIIYNMYAIIATFYIVPQIKKIKDYKRKGIKKILMDKGILLGMEVGMGDVMTSVLLLTHYKEWIFYSIPILYFLDLLYRLNELRFNKKFNLDSASNAERH